MSFQKSLIIPIVGAIVFALIMFVSSPEPKMKESKNVTKDFILGGQFTSGQPADEFEEPDGSSIANENFVEDAAILSKNNSENFIPNEKVPPGELYGHITFFSTPLEIRLPDFPDVLEPTTYQGVVELLDLLKGFGDLINSPEGILSQEFAKLDSQILAKTKEVYRNPHQILGGSAFTLGEQCGLPGGTFSYPPGANDIFTACGGTPPVGGTQGAPFVSGATCNTHPPCYFSGFCFQSCYNYLVGSYCYCWVPSCYGMCGKGSYLWDSVTGTCGCTDSISSPGSWSRI